MADKIVTQDPTKPGQFKVLGPTMVNNLVPLAGLDGTGAALNSVISFNGATWVPAAAPPSADTASNLGAGAQSFKSKVGADFQFRSIIGAGSIVGVQNANDITLTGAIITSSNLGAGNGVFSAKVGNDLQFKSLIAGANVTLTPTATDITIALAGSSGVFTASFTSAGQTITASGSLTLAHGLAANPKLVTSILKCTSADNNFSVNDELVMPVLQSAPGAACGAVVTYDATNLYIRFGSTGSTYQALDKTTGGQVGLTNAKWNVIFKAFA